MKIVSVLFVICCLSFNAKSEVVYVQDDGYLRAVDSSGISNDLIQYWYIPLFKKGDVNDDPYRSWGKIIGPNLLAVKLELSRNQKIESIAHQGEYELQTGAWTMYNPGPPIAVLKKIPKSMTQKYNSSFSAFNELIKKLHSLAAVRYFNPSYKDSFIGKGLFLSEYSNEMSNVYSRMNVIESLFNTIPRNMDRTADYANSLIADCNERVNNINQKITQIKKSATTQTDSGLPPKVATNDLVKKPKASTEIQGQIIESKFTYYPVQRSPADPISPPRNYFHKITKDVKGNVTFTNTFHPNGISLSAKEFSDKFYNPLSEVVGKNNEGFWVYLCKVGPNEEYRYMSEVDDCQEVIDRVLRLSK